MTIWEPTEKTLSNAAQILIKGGIVAIPTETVYGLAADATQSVAVEKIFLIKKRPSINPLIIHVPDPSMVNELAATDSRFHELTTVFWPGPLTIVLKQKAKNKISELVSSGLTTLAVRQPNHPVTSEILRKVQRPIAAPSANMSGAVSPTRATHVEDSIGQHVNVIIDGGRCKVGLESTVIDLSTDVPVILRPGVITQEQIGQIIGFVNLSSHDSDLPKSPGQLAKHYAPSLPLRLNAEEAREGEAFLAFSKAGKAAIDLSPSGNLLEAARNLFFLLRHVDKPDLYSSIAVMPIPEVGIGIAINDRLQRAAQLHGQESALHNHL